MEPYIKIYKPLLISYFIFISLVVLIWIFGNIKDSILSSLLIHSIFVYHILNESIFIKKNYKTASKASIIYSIVSILLIALVLILLIIK